MHDERHCVSVISDVLHVDRSRIFPTRDVDVDLDVGFDHLIGLEQWAIEAE